MTDDDRDELVVELLTRILARLDTVEEELGGTAKVMSVDPEMFVRMVDLLGMVDKSTAGIEARLRQAEPEADTIRPIVRREAIDAVAPVLRYIDDDARRYENERSRMQERIDALDRANRTWLWAAPALALATLVVFVLGTRLAMNTAIGCTALGGKYEATGRGFVDLCFFAAGGWW